MEIPEQLLWPAIAIGPEAADLPTIELGQSRFGGTPDAPRTFRWPQWKGRPLSFLAQINLAEVAGFACSINLPKRGWLLFFYDAEETPWGYEPEDAGCSYIEFVDTPADQLVRQTPPMGLSAEGVFASAKLQFSPITTTPDPWSIWLDGLTLTADDRFELAERIDEGDERYVCHQIGGHASPIQGEMETECQLVTNGINCGGPSGYQSEKAEMLKPGARDWRCLLQIDSDDDVGWMWGDSGRIYFWIREADLAQRDFSKCWLVLQCF
jgi:uncharacterized protein YwqG